MNDPRDTYRSALAAILAQADVLPTDADGLLARVAVLRELREAIAAGLLSEPAGSLIDHLHRANRAVGGGR